MRAHYLFLYLFVVALDVAQGFTQRKKRAYALGNAKHALPTTCTLLSLYASARLLRGNRALC